MILRPQRLKLSLCSNGENSLQGKPCLRSPVSETSRYSFISAVVRGGRGRLKPSELTAEVSTVWDQREEASMAGSGHRLCSKHSEEREWLLNPTLPRSTRDN